MSAISLKSITGITSITTPAGVDNQLTLHTNDTTQRVKVTESGVEIAGVTTTSGDLFVANGDLVLPSSGKSIKIWTGGTQGLILNHGGSFGELDNLTGMLRIKAGRIKLSNRFGNLDMLTCNSFGSVDLFHNNILRFTTTGYGVSTTGLEVVGVSTFAGNIDANGDLDVDGHTNLDNVSIAGITTIASGSYFNSVSPYRIANHPVLGYDSFTDISGGSYATRLGSTGTSTLRSTQIYGGGNVLATFDGVNYRLGLGITAPEAALHLNFNNGFGSVNNTLRFTNTDTDVTSNETTGKIEWETKDSSAAGIHAYLKVLCSNTGYSSMHFGTGNASTLTDRLKITQDGDVNIIDGDLVMASGHGIDFSATANGTGAGHDELLDDYEEGSWTPSFDTSISGGSITVGGYVTQSGFYRKIGSLVYVEGALKTTSVTKNSNGTYDVGGLPFTAASGGGAGTSGILHAGAQANWSVAPDKFDIIGSNTRARARGGLNDGAGQYTNANTSGFNTSSGQYNRVYFSGVYIAE